MTPEKAIKQEAKKRLSGNWPAAVGAAITIIVAFMTVQFLSSVIFSTVTLLINKADPAFAYENPLALYSVYFALNIIGFILILPLITGFVRFSYLISKDGYCDYSQIFCYLHRQKYFSSLLFCLRLILKNFWQTVVSFLPGAVCLFSAGLSAEGKEQLAFSDIIWYYIGYSLVFAGIIFFSYLSEDSFLAIYYYIDNKSNYTDQILAYSEINMIRCRKSYVKLQLSLLPMMLSCILVIPCLFAIPYIATSQATSAKWIIALSDKNEV